MNILQLRFDTRPKEEKMHKMLVKVIQEFHIMLAPKTMQNQKQKID